MKKYLMEGRQPVHRRVAESKLGRKLQPGEHVHHLDGDKHNNDPDNLVVLSHAEHVALHNRLTPRRQKGRVYPGDLKARQRRDGWDAHRFQQLRAAWFRRFPEDSTHDTGTHANG